MHAGHVFQYLEVNQSITMLIYFWLLIFSSFQFYLYSPGLMQVLFTPKSIQYNGQKQLSLRFNDSRQYYVTFYITIDQIAKPCFRDKHEKCKHCSKSQQTPKSSQYIGQKWLSLHFNDSRYYVTVFFHNQPSRPCFHDKHEKCKNCSKSQQTLKSSQCIGQKWLSLRFNDSRYYVTVFFHNQPSRPCFHDKHEKCKNCSKSQHTCIHSVSKRDLSQWQSKCLQASINCHCHMYYY